MKASIKWLSEILGEDLDASIVAERLTQAGVEIDEVIAPPVPGQDVVIARIVERRKHPSRDDLFVVRVDGGNGTHEVVCGAPNTPGPGADVVLARPGARVQGHEITTRKLAGVESAGMLCSEAELAIGPDESGILILEEEFSPGTQLARAYDLDDRILEYTITPNRPDCLGHVGLAREVSAVLGLTFRTPVPDLEAAELDVPVQDLATVRIEDPVGCPRYAAAVVQGVKVKPAPFMMRHRLHLLGVRPISNIVDVTNWILLLDNQPLHAFDRTLLPDGLIIVRRARAGETMVTLDEVEQKLVQSDLVIAGRDRSIAVAGVMGGEGTSVTDETSDVLIECAYFDPGSIRSTSARLKLQSESSYRFERGTDPSPIPQIVRHAAAMMVRLGGGGVARGIVDVYPERIQPARIVLRVPRVEKIVGAPFDEDECLRALLALGCTVKVEDGKLEVAAPTHRPDLTREIDLVEEVARLRGYDTIPVTYPFVQARPPERANYDTLLRLKRAMAAAGLDEVVSLSLVHSKRLEDLELPWVPVKIANPLTADRDVMRTSLVPGLLDLLQYHLSRLKMGLGVFEVGTVFRADDGGMVEGVVEKKECAGLVFGPRPSWVGERRGHANFHDAWGAVHNALSDLWDEAPGLRRMEQARPWLHPRSASAIVADGVEVGWVGELHPRHALKLGLPVDRDGTPLPVGLFAFEVSTSHAVRPRFNRYSEMPQAERDIAMV
ncbi:MAG: phenylalanine--tRNA ligase subunit beta, partial [Deltaproteobacteria bacterium]|nr:phenylalanine--tRNA ligase subunit beta [Deltaproteobacteria bacterium]